VFSPRTWRLRAAVVGIAAVAMLATACGSGDSGSDNPSTTAGTAAGQSSAGSSSAPADSGDGGSGGTAVMAIDADPPTLNPGLTTDYTVATNIAAKVFEGLVYLDPDGKPQPELATSWDISDDQLTYTFHLREGVVWQDGEPFTSADVKWSYETGLKQNSRAQGALEHVASIDTPDENTVVINLSEPYAPFLNQMKVFDCPILPQHVYGEGDIANNPANQAPVGTGPFKFDSWNHGSSVTLVANDKYWAEGEPKLDKLIMQVITDPSQRTSALTTGQVDFIGAYYLATTDVPGLKSNQDVTVRTQSAIPALDFMAMNEKNKYLADKKVRQAIAMAVDRDRIVQQAVAGLAVPGKGSFGNGFPWAYDESVSYDKLYPMDPDKAKQMLADAGVPEGTTLRLTYYAQNAKFSAAAEIIKDNLKQVGIDVTLQPMETAVFKENVYAKRDFDLAIQSFTSSGDPAIGYHRLYVSNEGTDPNVNATGYSNPKVDELLTKAGEVSDQDKRSEYYYQAQQILNEDVPTLILFDEQQADAYSNKLSGLYAGQNPDDQWGKVSIAQK
jgi:peptide/nickel transport system substrate-binding protein